ncbi:S41 family peptidase [Asticcacaulis sp. BYS171W]|uniref:S41 family peptidase n=1 Tax=Asticcacaulis aquaticus TaxID=2984212 RepID=A0ABT5HPM4_9CAUL|nr:S41 family peptidase [Asticcacaulis aquaticus]MDC7682006.1 S41 family peptidase [Asticcacaulis aquaticus]
MRKLLIAVSLIGAHLLLASCGGGGGGGTTSTPSTGGGTTVTGWVSGVFQAASSFKSKCETVRTGVDIEGNRFTDTAGTATDEKNWLRSWTRETYLWNTEVADTDPALGGTRTAYFATLRTTAKTSSGKDKDNFHFSQSTEEYLKARNSTASASYGLKLVAYSTTVPRDYRIVYTEPGSPSAGIVPRGARIMKVNDVSLVSDGTQAGVNVLNAGLFPASAGTVTKFEFLLVDGTTKTVNLTSANVSPKAVNTTSVITRGSSKVGYILFNTFSPYASETEIVTAMRDMQTAGVSDLVLDLRYNGGGLLAVASELSYMIAGNTRTTGRTFEKLQFNAAAGTRNPVTGEANNPVPFYTTALGFSLTAGTTLPTLNLSRVYILATDSTCSASEAVINGLRGVGVEVVLIGSKTCGKPYGFYPQDNCGETFYTIQFQGVNDVGFGDYADGFVPLNTTETTGVKLPGCQAADDLSRDLGNSSERLLSTALSYRDTLSCPVVATSEIQKVTLAVQSSSASATGASGIELAPLNHIMDVNRDMTLPGRM